MASSTYGASRVRLHPSIYSVFLQPGRRPISRSVLLMEYIEGPAISSIISELTSYPSLLKYLKNRVGAVLEESIRIYDSKFPSLRSDGKITAESRARLLENSVNFWINSYAERTMVFSVNLYRRLLYLLDLFHRGGTSFYPEELEDFSRGKWKASRSFRIHCDFHQGNILVKVSERFRGERSEVYNLTFRDMLEIDLYRDLKIIDLEDAVELRESDFPVPVDRLVGTHPCPVYLTDAEGFSARLLSNIILISSTLSQSLSTLQDFFSGGGTRSLIFENKVVSDWISGGDSGRSSELQLQLADFSFKLRDSTLRKLAIHSSNWDRYVDLIRQDDVLKPCTSYYHLKYGRKQPPKSQLPCSWLSNILFSKKACRYLEVAHTVPDLSGRGAEEAGLEIELAELFKLSNLTKCHIDESEALQISVANVSSSVEEFLPPVSDVNETSWGEWAALFHSQGSAEGSVSSETSGPRGSGGAGANSNSKKVSDHNSPPCSNHLSGASSKSNVSQSGRRDPAKKEDKSKVVFGSIDVPKDKGPSRVLNWLDVNQMTLGKEEGGPGVGLLRQQDSDGSAPAWSEAVSKEFDKILIELMGLAALQRIISFCSKFSLEIDCENVTSSKITRDGPISSYVVRMHAGANSTHTGPGSGSGSRSGPGSGSGSGPGSGPDFLQFLDPCVLHSDGPGETGWLCSNRSREALPARETAFKIVVDGRLFLDVNRTFVGLSNGTFAFRDILAYFGINGTSKYTSEFNQEAVSIIDRHRRDALEFWKLESKIRNLDDMVHAPASASASALPKMFIFHSKLSAGQTQPRPVLSPETTDSRLYFMSLNGKRSDLSRQISSVVQTGLLSENVFFIGDPSNNHVSGLVSKVTNFQNEVFSIVWVSYATLVLSIIEGVLRSHSYQVLVSYRVLELLHSFRAKRDYDISTTRGGAGDVTGVEVQIKRDSIPVICGFSLKRIAVQQNGSSDLLRLFGELSRFTLYNTSGARFTRPDEGAQETCPGSQSTDKFDIQTLIKDLVWPALDPVSTLGRAVESLSKVKFNSSIEVRRSNWFVKHVCSYISQKLLEFAGPEPPSTPLPTLIRSLSLIMETRTRISSDPTFSRCVKTTTPQSSDLEFTNCTIADYISISQTISSELLQLFSRESSLFENSTSLSLAQELMNFAKHHLQTPQPEEPPPPGGLGHLFKKEFSHNTPSQEEVWNNSNLIYNRNNTIAFDMKWPIIANISNIIQHHNYTNSTIH